MPEMTADDIQREAGENLMSLAAWEDPEHPGNRIRPKVKCIGCDKKGCITAWGPWCFECNKERMYRINGNLNEIAQSYGLPDPQFKANPSR